MQITTWHIQKDDGSLIFNHIEMGLVDGNFPKPKKAEFANQKAWENMKWSKKYANLINNVVVYNG